LKARKTILVHLLSEGTVQQRHFDRRQQHGWQVGMNDHLKNLITNLGSNTSGCYVCGQSNQNGLRVTFHRDGQQGSRAVYVARLEHDGWPGVLHGGITFALMDEALAWALFFQGLRGVTARTQANFRRPILTGTPLIIRGWTISRKRQLINARAEVRTDDATSELMAETDATMFLLAEDAPKQLPEEELTTSDGGYSQR